MVFGAHRGLVPQLAGAAAGAPTNSASPAGVGESVPTSPFAHLPPVPVGEPDLYCYETLDGVVGAGGSSIGRVSCAREQGTPLHQGRRNDDEEHAPGDARDGAHGLSGPAGASTALSGVVGATVASRVGITSVSLAAGAPATALRRDEAVVGERLTDALRTQLYEAVLRDQSRPRQSPLGGSTGGGGQMQLDLPSVGLKATANSSARARQSSGGGGGGKGTGSAAKRDLAAAPTPLSTAKQGARGERSADEVAAKGATTRAAPKPKRSRGGNTGDENPYGKHYADSHIKRRRGSADAGATTPSVKAEGEEAGFD